MRSQLPQAWPVVGSTSTTGSTASRPQSVFQELRPRVWKATTCHAKAGALLGVLAVVGAHAAIRASSAVSNASSPPTRQPTLALTAAGTALAAISWRIAAGPTAHSGALPAGKLPDVA